MSDKITEDEYWDAIDKALAEAQENYEPRGKPWIEREIELVRKYYKVLPRRVLAEKMGRTMESLSYAYSHYCND